MIRTLVVDDVALARERVIRMLGAHADILLVGEAADGDEAMAMAGALAPDLIVLDIAMPNLDGVSLARRLEGARPPLVLFHTAHKQHAVSAFEVEALDYLLKPVTTERLAEALARIRKALAQRSARDPAGLVIADGGRTSIVPHDRIDYIAADGHYLIVHADGRSMLIREPIAAVERRLGPGFLRIHRSTIARLDRIAAVIGRRNGDADAVLTDGTALRVSRTYRAALDRWLVQAASRPRTAHAPK